MDLKLHKFCFDGQILKRGFWLYVWRITHDSKIFLYVGRTGDSSSANAASPFSRVSRHLDLREGAKSNTLTRNLRKAGIEPSACNYEFFAIGPIFPEAHDFTLHKETRDRIAAVEAALAKELSGRGYDVLGKHGPRKSRQPKILQCVLAALPSELLEPNVNEESIA